MTLPATLTQAPHSNASVDLGLDSIRPGRLEQGERKRENLLISLP